LQKNPDQQIHDAFEEGIADWVKKHCPEEYRKYVEEFIKEKVIEPLLQELLEKYQDLKSNQPG